MPSTFPNLKRLRDETGLSQQALADFAGIRQATLSEWERGEVLRVELPVLDKLCAALGKKLKRTVTLYDLRKKPKQ